MMIVSRKKYDAVVADLNFFAFKFCVAEIALRDAQDELNALKATLPTRDKLGRFTSRDAAKGVGE